MLPRGFYADRQTVDPHVVRIAVLFVVVPLLIGALCWLLLDGWPTAREIGRILFVYRVADAQVLDERCESHFVHHQTRSSRGKGSGGIIEQEVKYYRYRPAFQIAYQVNDRRHVAWTYDAYQIWYGENAKHRILALYRPGDDCRCWYDPADPTRVVLTRAIPLGECFWAIGPVVAVAIPGGLLWMAWPLLFYRGKNRRPRIVDDDNKD